MAARKPSKNKAKTRTSMFISTDALRASSRKAAKLGISRGLYLEQLIRKDTGLGVGVDLDADAPSTISVFE